MEVWEIYQILKEYTTKDSEINTPILLKLLKDKTNTIELLQKIPILHYSYISKLNAYFATKAKELPDG